MRDRPGFVPGLSHVRPEGPEFCLSVGTEECRKERLRTRPREADIVRVMTRWLRSSSALLTFASAVACGAPKSAPGPTDPNAVATSAAPTTGDDNPDLSEVSAPEDLVFVARWRSPAVTVDTLLAWTNLPLDWRSLMDRALPAKAKGAANTVFALDAPVDLAVTLGARTMAEPEPQAVIAVGLQSVEAGVRFAEAMGEDVEDLGRGVFAVGGGGELDCVIAPATGPAAARLVCSDEESAVDALLPYVTRGLPHETLSQSDLHLELRVAPIRKSYGPLLQQAAELQIPFLLRELSLDDPAFDRSLASAVGGITAEVIALLDDVEKLTLDLELTEKTQHLDMAFAAEFRGTKSWIAQGVADAPGRARIAPPQYWSLPATASAASYQAPPNPDRMRPVRETAADLADSLLSHQKLPAGLRRDVRYLVESTGTSTAVRVAVQGPVPGSEKKTQSGELAEILSGLDRQWGWQAVGYIDEPAAEFFRYFDTLVKVASDPAVEKLIRRQLPDVKTNEIPKLRSKRLFASNLSGSKQYDLVLPLKAWTDGATDDGKLVIVVMPRGNNTWVGSSLDEKVLLAEMAKLEQPGQTLQDRRGLDELRKHEHFSGGFLTARHILESVLRGSLELKSGDVNRVFAVMPHHGETPIVSTVDHSNQNGPRFELTVSAPKDVVQDLAAAMPALMANSLLSGL